MGFYTGRKHAASPQNINTVTDHPVRRELKCTSVRGSGILIKKKLFQLFYNEMKGNCIEEFLS